MREHEANDGVFTAVFGRFLCSTARLCYEENSDFRALPVTRICKIGLSARSQLSSVMLYACEYGFMRRYLDFS